MASVASEHVPVEAAAPSPSAARLLWAAVWTLWQRDMRRFVRQPSRIVGALAQPLIFWLVIGSGFAGSFHVAGAEGLGYLEYFFPGILLMLVLFSSIFSTMSVIEDRHAGFLQAVLVAPAPRLALVLGKTLGGTSVALIQAAMLLPLASWAGFPLGQVHWLAAIGLLAAASMALTALGFALAWALDSTQGYHAIMSVLLLPMWILSGAMFPPGGGHSAWIAHVMAWNPLSYAVLGLRRALYGGTLPPALGGTSSLREVVVTLGFLIGAVALAALAVSAPTHKRRYRGKATAR